MLLQNIDERPWIRIFYRAWLHKQFSWILVEISWGECGSGWGHWEHVPPGESAPRRPRFTKISVVKRKHRWNTTRVCDDSTHIQRGRLTLLSQLCLVGNCWWQWRKFWSSYDRHSQTTSMLMISWNQYQHWKVQLHQWKIWLTFVLRVDLTWQNLLATTTRFGFLYR